MLSLGVRVGPRPRALAAGDRSQTSPLGPTLKRSFAACGIKAVKRAEDFFGVFSLTLRNLTDNALVASARKAFAMFNEAEAMWSSVEPRAALALLRRASRVRRISSAPANAADPRQTGDEANPRKRMSFGHFEDRE